MKKLLTIFFIITILASIGSSVFAITASITTDELNIRESPSTDSTSIGVLKEGEKVDILSTEGDWHKINYEGKEGYINKNYVKVENDNVETKQETAKNQSNNKTDSINGDMTLNVDTELYTLPLLNSVKYTTIPKGTKIKMISNNGKWLYIQTDTDSGWIISSKTSTQAKQNEDTQNTKPQNNETVSNNTTNTISNSVTNALENTTQANTVENANQTSETEKTETTSNGEYPVVMYVNTDSVNVRSKPDASSSVISGAAEGSDLEVLGKEGDWYKVDTEDGVGYIKSEFLSKNR